MDIASNGYTSTSFDPLLGVVRVWGCVRRYWELYQLARPWYEMMDGRSLVRIGRTHMDICYSKFEFGNRVHRSSWFVGLETGKTEYIYVSVISDWRVSFRISCPYKTGSVLPTNEEGIWYHTGWILYIWAHLCAPSTFFRVLWTDLALTAEPQSNSYHQLTQIHSTTPILIHNPYSS